MPNAATGKNAAVKTHPDLGRIVVPDGVPDGFRLFYTTIDFDGRIDDRVTALAGAPITQCTQVHSAVVMHAPQSGTCDALWSDRANTALAIKVADCLPVSIIDPKSNVIANIHSGWRGAVQNITAVTLDAMRFEPAESIAFLGPTIRVCCFEVGEEVAERFETRLVDRNRGPKPHVDIAAFTADVLRGRGIENIVDTGLCTRCDGSIFHSYRRDKKSGRNLAIVAQ